MVMPRAGSSFSLCVHSGSHSQLWWGNSQGGWTSPGAPGGHDFPTCLGDRFSGWAGVMVSKSGELAIPPSIVAFLLGDALSGPSTRNFQDHGPDSPEVEEAAERLVGRSPEELGQSAVSAWVRKCWAFQQPSGRMGSVGPALPRLGAADEELAASSKACGIPSFLWGILGPSILGGFSVTSVNRPGTTGFCLLGSLDKKASSSSPSPAPVRGGTRLTSGVGAKVGSCTPWLFSGPSSASSSEESTSRMASCFCSDSRRSARSCRRVPRAHEGEGCSTPFPGSAPFPDSTLLVPTTSRGLTSLGGSSFFSSGWGRSRLCFREVESFFSEAASAAASFSADCTLFSSGERGGSALLGRESCLPRGGDK